MTPPTKPATVTAEWTDITGATFTVEGDADGIARIVGGSSRMEQRFEDFGDGEIAEMRHALVSK